MSYKSSLCAIKEFSSRFNASLRTIRYYEQIGLLKPQRIKHFRLFSEDDYRRMRFIESAKALGLTLAEILDLLESKDASDSVREIKIPPELLRKRIFMLEQQRVDLESKLEKLRAAERDVAANSDRTPADA